MKSSFDLFAQQWFDLTINKILFRRFFSFLSPNRMEEKKKQCALEDIHRNEICLLKHSFFSVVKKKTFEKLRLILIVKK
jgi:hypothetical protein